MTDARAWLNGLSKASAASLFAHIRTHGGLQEIYNNPVPSDLACYAPIDSGEWTGAQWSEHITCETLAGGSGIDMSGYPRFQLKFGKRSPTGVVQTPVKTGSLGVRIRDLLSNQEWVALKSCADSTGGKFNMPVHHLAYTVRRFEEPTVGLPELPADLGAGMAVAHLCDRKTCCKVQHSYLLSQVLNMDMQRCLGVTLLVKDGVILQTQQCPHFKADASGQVLQPSCAKAQVVTASPHVSCNPQFQTQYDTARRKYLELLDVEIAVD